MKTRSQALKERGAMKEAEAVVDEFTLEADQTFNAALDKLKGDTNVDIGQSGGEIVSDAETGDVLPADEPSDLEVTPGPWCPLCAHAFDRTETSVQLALSLNQAVACPGCTKNIIPSEHEPSPGDVTKASIPEDVQGIIRSVFEVDYKAQWQRLTADLTIGELRTDYSTIVRALDLAEDNARLAHLVFVNIRVEYERYKIDSEAVEAAMREEATSVLQAEKDQKTRNKTITEADVTAKMAEMHPDQFRSTRTERARFKGTVDHAEQLFERWARRAFALQAILTTMRK